MRGPALGYQTQGRERRKQERVRRRVDEVCEPRECRREAHRGSVKRGDEDLRVAVEGLCYVQVVGYEAAQPFFVEVCAGRVCPADGYIGAAVV